VSFSFLRVIEQMGKAAFTPGPRRRERGLSRSSTARTCPTEVSFLGVTSSSTSGKSVLFFFFPPHSGLSETSESSFSFSLSSTSPGFPTLSSLFKEPRGSMPPLLLWSPSRPFAPCRSKERRITTHFFHSDRSASTVLFLRDLLPLVQDPAQHFLRRCVFPKHFFFPEPTLLLFGVFSPTRPGLSITSSSGVVFAAVKEPLAPLRTVSEGARVSMSPDI